MTRVEIVLCIDRKYHCTDVRVMYTFRLINLLRSAYLYHMKNVLLNVALLFYALTIVMQGVFV